MTTLLRVARAALLLVFVPALCGAQEGLRLVVRLSDSTAAVGEPVRVQVLTVAPGFGMTVVRGAMVRASCGTVDERGELRPTQFGTCTVTASFKSPAGETLSASTKLTVFVRARQQAPPPAPVAPPPPPDEVRRRVVMDRRIGEYPQFPWPVPRATDHFNIPRGLISRPIGPGETAATVRDTLGAVADSVEKALVRADVPFVVYAIGSTGFAYVTKPERFRLPEGAPEAGPDRFPPNLSTPSGSSSFLELIVSRFRARPGHYRVVAIVVTSRPIAQQGPELTADAAMRLAKDGMPTLPSDLRAKIVAGLQGIAYVYEFVREGATDDVVELNTGRLVPARQHLVAAGLWTAERLQP